MFHVTTNPLEVVLRVLIVYAGLAVLLRVTGKKELGQLAPMDFLAMLILSETISPALTGGDTSVTAALVAAAALLAVTFLTDWLTFRFRLAAKVLHGRARVVIRDGKVVPHVQTRERLSLEELEAAVRGEGIDDFKKVKRAFVETNGRISVIPESD